MSAVTGVSDVADLVAAAARESGTKLAVVEAGGRSLSWSELDDEVGRFATALGSAGVLGGHRVLIVIGNRLEFVTSYLGTLRAQAVAVPVNPSSVPGELARMITDSGARLVVCDADSVDGVRTAVADLAESPRVVVAGAAPGAGEVAYDDFRSVDARPVPQLLDPEKLACLLYTSGTSGRPRAAMLTHRALLANIEQVTQVEPPMMHGDDVVLGVLPLFHVYGLNAVLGNVIAHRAKLVLVDRFEPQSVLDLIDDEACSVLPVAPPVFAYWRDEAHLAERLGPVRLVLSGSAPLDPDQAAEFHQRTDLFVHQGYGLTEASPVVTSTLCSARTADGSGQPRTLGTVGAPLPGIDIRLVDELGATPAGDDPGEIQIRGGNLFSGYWPDGQDGPDADGWWSTGDVGYLDGADLVLVDRIKELVIVSGFNVYPVEVEEVVREVDGVAETAVIGVPDPQTGEAVVLYVVPTSPDQPDLVDRVGAHCATRLARFKQPVRIEVVDALPLTVTGKVQKGRLRGMERRRTGPSGTLLG